MTRTLAIAVSLVIATFTLADDPKKSDAEPPAFAVEVEPLKQGVEKKLRPIHAAVEKEYEAAKTDGDREAIRKKSHEKSAEVHTPAYEQAMKLLRPNAADPAAAVGLVWVSHAREAALQHEAVGLLRKHHLVRPEAIELAKGMKQSGFGWVEGMLRAQLAAADLPQDHQAFGAVEGVVRQVDVPQARQRAQHLRQAQGRHTCSVARGWRAPRRCRGRAWLGHRAGAGTEL